MATPPPDPGPLVAVAHAAGDAALTWAAVGPDFPLTPLPAGDGPTQGFAADRDGRLLAVERQPEEGPGQVWLVDPTTGQASRLPAPGAGDWALSAPVVAPDGRHLCVAGRPASLPLDELFVYQVQRGDSGLTAEVVAGVALEGAFRSQRPGFVPGSDTLVYLRQQSTGLEVALLELGRDGDSAAGIQGEAPSRRRFTVSQGARAVPAVAPAWHAEGRRLIHAQPAPGDRVQVAATGPGQGTTPASVAHDRVLAVAAGLDGPEVAWVADGAVWWAELPALAAHRVGGPTPLGPLVAVPGGFVYATAGGLAWCAGPGEALPWVLLETAPAALAALPVGHRALARVAALGIEPPDRRSDAALAARADFVSWLTGLPDRADGLEALAVLGELADEAAVRWAVAEHLAVTGLARRLDGPGRTANALLFALSAAGQVGEGVSTQAALCAEAAPRVAEHGDVDPPTWLALALLEAEDPRQVAPQAALEAHAAWRAERRDALDAGDRDAVEAVCGPLAARLATAGERVGSAPAVPEDPALVDPLAAARQAVEAALDARAAAEADRAERAAEARARAERAAEARAQAAEEAAKQAAAEAEVAAARAAAAAHAEAAAEAKAAEAEAARADADRATVAALAAEAVRRAEAGKIAAQAERSGPPPAQAPDADRVAALQAGNAQLTAALADARAKVEAADGRRAKAAAARDAAQAERDEALAAQQRAEAAAADLRLALAKAEAARDAAVSAAEAAKAAQAVEATARVELEAAYGELEVDHAQLAGRLAAAERARDAFQARLDEEQTARLEAKAGHAEALTALQARVAAAKAEVVQAEDARAEAEAATPDEPPTPAARGPRWVLGVLGGLAAGGGAFALGAPAPAAAAAGAAALVAGLWPSRG